MLGVPDWKPLPLMRDFLVTLRGLLAGERIDYAGTAVNLRGVSLGRRKDAPRVPVYLGALGPGMLRLAGEASDGAALNWCNPEQIAWSRERVAEGAARADRDPSEVRIVEYIRVCVDDDEDATRRALARAILPYALVQPGASKDHGYRAHFARMGFDAALSGSKRAAIAGLRPQNSPTPSRPIFCNWSATSAQRRARRQHSATWRRDSIWRSSASCRYARMRRR
jgi:5,10-methylenetetrahydromethanopterin reductase